MDFTRALTRRSLKNLTGLLLPAFAPSLTTASQPSIRGERLRLALASYSTSRLTVEQTIAICKRSAIRYITLKSAHLSLQSTREQRREMRARFADAGIEVVGCGVIYLDDEQQARHAFQYVQDLGAKIAVVGVRASMVRPLEKVLRDFDLLAAIHNHGPGDDRGATSALEVWRWVQGADRKVGICMDVGHTFRCGHDPVLVAEKCAERLYDIHMKDLSAQDKAVPVGQGVIDIVRLLKTLVRLKYRYHVSLEYETDRDNPAAGIAESFGFQRGVLAALESGLG